MTKKSASPLHLRVLSYNIHKGFTVGKWKYVLDGIREGIRQSRADLVFLQEVLGHDEVHDGRRSHYPRTSQFEYLADGAWTHFAYGRNAVYSQGHHGNAILSKYPIRKWSNHDLSTNRWESRGLLHAVLDIPEIDYFHVFGTHLNLLERSRHVQIDQICDYIQDEIKDGDPILLAGDFNDWRGTLTPKLQAHLGLNEAHKKIHGRHARSFPSFFPRMALDRIYYRGVEVFEAKTLHGDPWAQLSDHLALYAEFVL